MILIIKSNKLTNKNNPIINTIIFNLLYTNKSSKKIILLDILMFFETIFIVITLLIIYQYFDLFIPHIVSLNYYFSNFFI